MTGTALRQWVPRPTVGQAVAAVALVLLVPGVVLWERPSVTATGAIIHLTLSIAAVVMCCHLAGRVARVLGQPAVIGQIAAGIALGPSLLGRFAPQVSEVVFPASVQGPMAVLATVGVLLFLFVAALETDLYGLRDQGRLTAVVAQTGFVVPFVLGAVFAWAIHSRLAPPGADLLPFVLLVGVAMSVTALPVLATILRDTPLRGTRLAAVAITSATAADVAAWVVLGVVAAIVGGAASGAVLVGMGTGLLLLGLVAVRPLLRRLVHADRLPVPLRMAVLLGGALAFAGLSEATGLHMIIGVFLFGLAVPRHAPVTRAASALLGPITAGVLAPLFFVGSGLATDVAPSSGALWGWIVLALAVAIAGKFGGAILGARSAGESWTESTRLGALLNCRGMTELVVLGIGLELGLLGPQFYSVLVVVAFICTAMTWPVIAATGVRPDPGVRWLLTRPQQSHDRSTP